MKKRRYLYCLMAAALSLGCTQGGVDDVNARLDEDEQALIDIKSRISEVQQALLQLNSDVMAIARLRGGAVIYSVSGSEAAGWTVTLSDGTVTVIPPSPASSGNAPVISVDDEGYWTVDYGEGAVYVLDVNGDKVSSKGKGATGNAGADGLSPILGLDADGYWQYSLDDGQTWTYVTTASGVRIQAVIVQGETLFDSVTSSGNTMTVTLKNGQQFDLPLVPGFLCAIEGAGTEQSVPKGGTRDFTVQMQGVLSAVVTCPSGWTAELSDGTLTVGAPAGTKAYFSTEASVGIFAVSAAGYSTISRIDVKAVDAD